MAPAAPGRAEDEASASARYAVPDDIAPEPARLVLFALFKTKAILHIGEQRRVLSVGEVSPEGVRLVSTDTEKEEAVVEVDGQRRVLGLGVIRAPDSASGPATATLWVGGNGFFHADGSINGQAVRFLVDTGANQVVLNSALARQLGIDFERGDLGMATTASGSTRYYKITINTIKVGDIVLHDVPAGVIDGPQPDPPLLGMSFLGRVEMRRDGRRMDLIKRY